MSNVNNIIQVKDYLRLYMNDKLQVVEIHSKVDKNKLSNKDLFTLDKGVIPKADVLAKYKYKDISSISSGVYVDKINGQDIIMPTAKIYIKCY